MRLAYFSPLNPASSGISDYSRELLPYLAAHADIALVVDSYTPTDAELKSFRVMDDRAFNARDFDLALYHLGNSPAHAYIYRRALQEPGVIVLHDFVLHHLVAWLTLNRGDQQGYITAMREAYGERDAVLVQRQMSSLELLNWFDFPLSEAVVEKARGVIAHSRYVADAVKRIAPNVPVAEIPHEMPEIPRLAQDDARAKLNLPPDARLIGMFGILGPTKRTTVLFEAFAAVRQSLPGARLLLVGQSSPNFDAHGLMDVFHLRDAVTVAGHVPFDAFHTYMAAVDVCVNLRYPTAGETSGAVLRSMAMARPVIVSRVGWFAELPDDAVAKIDVDDREVAQLTAALARLLEDGPLRAAMGENARRYVLEHCAVKDAARYYAEFLQAVHDGRAESKIFGERTDNRQQTTRDVQDKKRTTKSKEREREIENRSVSPRKTTKFETLTPDLAWRDELVRAYVELGLDANDVVLETVARAVSDLGLGPA